MLKADVKSIFDESARDEPPSPCPEMETLAAFIDGMLPSEQREAVESHLVFCDACLDRVIFSSPPLEGEAAEPRESLADIVVRFLRNSAEVIGNLADVTVLPVMSPATARGEGEAHHRVVCFSRNFAGIQARCEVKDLGGKRCEIKVLLSRDGHPLDNIRISLFHGDNEVESHMTVDGEALIETCGFHSYKLVMKKAGAPIGEMTISIENAS